MSKIRGFELVKEEARQNKVKCILLPKRSTKNSAGYDFLYKQFGNSIVVDVMCAIFKNLNIEQEKEKND